MSGQRKQHLYLVFDDWNSGYSIRKVNLSSSPGKRSQQPLSSDSGEDSEQPLSRRSGKGMPVFMRLPAQRGFPHFFTSAFGTKIMLMLPGASGNDDYVVPTIDVRDHTITFEPEANGAAFPIYFPVRDDTLYALDTCRFEVLRKPEQRGGRGTWVWQRLARPPFLSVDTSSYGVQPDGCILVSTKKDGDATFIFDTKENVWKLYGDWMFPFTGHGYYDHSLGGFVGLSKHPETFGRLFCCTMASTVTGDTGRGGLHPSPDFKCTKEAVYSKDPAEQHVSATLLHMSQGRFCLVECVSIDSGNTFRVPPTTVEDDPENFWVPPQLADPGDFRSPPVDDSLDFMLPPLLFDPWDFVGGGPQSGRYMYRVKTFSLSCDMKGDLKLKHSKVHCYGLPHAARIGSICQDPVAFWL